MNNWINSDHNAFNVKVSNVSGKYKYIINGSNGYQYESSEMTSGNTWTTNHANLDVTYTITIVNTGPNSLSAKVNITSFIN
ncbi:hypothetical protein DCE79_09635 [Lysinibacillus sp. 2017]|nr:hypothetical protein DCE79_09635 [Lysinibacillus sp. 2017]TGN36790.1 hypothetical protein E4L99_04340 [Lysinibacillus sp. S2017]